MRVLRLGDSGQDVKRWQTFLCGHNPSSVIIANGKFDEYTKQETQTFQTARGLTADGEVGPKTLGTAMTLGFNPLKDESVDEGSPNWPPPPDFSPLVGNAAREAAIGKFAYKRRNDAGEIDILGNWESENIVKVTLPWNNKVTRFNKKAVKQLVDLWNAWAAAGLLDRVLTFDGGFVPRFVRGSTTNLSNHSWGTAFDINAEWNGLGKEPARKGKKGSVRELVQLANQYGFFWGGHFKKRPDGMHFEIAKLF